MDKNKGLVETSRAGQEKNPLKNILMNCMTQIYDVGQNIIYGLGLIKCQNGDKN